MRERSIDGELLKEYEQWDFINNEMYGWCLREMSINEIKQRHEFTNTIQRWLIHINERYNCVPKYDWFCLLPAVTVDHSAAIFLRDALVEKQFVNDRSNADKTIERLLSFIRERHKFIEKKYGRGSIARAPLRLEFDSGRQLIIAEKFRCRRIARVKSLVEKGGLVNTARVLLRYESLGNGSYQWGSAQEVYQIFYHQFGVRFEGFASPLDSSLIVYPHVKFCSLFSDTDCVFGSLGDFFYVDMDKYRGGWSLNPPFVNDLMLCVAKRVESVLEIGPHWWFLCRFPCWPDDSGWITLNSSKHLIKRIDFKPRQFTVQTTYGKKFKHPMEINIFILGEIPSEMTNQYELGNILLHDLYNSHEDPCP